jgi:very-short-patch-repair endonuclease
MTRVNTAIAGLPSPAPQCNILDRDGVWIARVDFAWPEHKIILECDGFEFHGSREAFERDRRRWTALTRAGWRVVIVTWRDVLGDPGYLIDVVSDMIGA